MQLPSKNDLFSVYQQVSSKVKQYAKNLTPIELKVEEATSNEPWGPHGTVMAEITKASHDYENYKQIMGIIARRLQSEGESWRHVYKSLLLLEYMCKHGPQKVVSELSSNIGTVEGLERFQYKDKNGKDWGLNVRQRAKELRSLVTNPELIRRERQKAKENSSKYTGVSSEESRMGGFGSSNSGFGSSASSMGSGSALSRLELGSNKPKGSALAGFGNSDSLRSSRYDDDLDSGHQALSADDMDEDIEDSKQATQKRMESLKKAEPGSPSRKPRAGALKQAAAEAEARGPKKLSQIKVDPSIAKSLGVPSRGPSPAPSAASAAPSKGQNPTEMLDLFGDSTSEAAAPSSQSTQETSWGAFGDTSAGAGQPAAKPPLKEQSDDWASLLDGPSTAAATPPALADPFAATPSAVAAPVQATDPFAARPSPAAAQQDPFAVLSSSASGERKAGGALPLAPTPQKSKDPFAILAAESPHAALAPKPQSPLKAATAVTAKPSAANSFDPFAFPTPPASAGNSTAVPPSSKIGQALPEDMFAAPAFSQQGNSVRVQVGVPTQQRPNSQQQPFAQQQGFGSGSTQQGSPSKAAPGFGAFPATSTEDMFGSLNFATPSASDRNAEALGGGMKMAPSLPQPNLPPPVSKQDPFAGLAGF